MREKTCPHCQKSFQWNGQPFASWAKQKFCSKACADAGGLRYFGVEHPNYKENARRKNRRGQHGSWARKVLSRDHETCQECGATGVQMHAHHIKPYAQSPELRFDVSNGITLCYSCHWQVHAAANENGVNSVDALTGGAEGNTEPSFGRKPVEGVTTSGRAYRRWTGSCEQCGTFISKRWSDAKGKKHLFCSKKCAGKFNAALRNAHGSNTATSALRESEEIVCTRRRLRDV